MNPLYTKTQVEELLKEQRLIVAQELTYELFRGDDCHDKAKRKAENAPSPLLLESEVQPKEEGVIAEQPNEFDSPEYYWKVLETEFNLGSPQSFINQKCKTHRDLIIYAMEEYAQHVSSLSKIELTEEEIITDAHHYATRFTDEERKYAAQDFFAGFKSALTKQKSI